MIVTVTLNPALDKALTVTALCPGELHRASVGPVIPAGKGINVALVARSWGVQTLAIVLAGDGRERLAAYLAGRDVAAQIIPVAGEMRTNIKLFAQNEAKMTEINEPGPTVTPDDLLRLENALLSIHNAELVVMSGSLPPGAPPDLYVRLANLMFAQGKRVVVDTSGVALRNAAMVPLFALKPNRVEAEELVGEYVNTAAGSQRDADLLNALQKTSIPHIALTLGADGACFAAEGRRIRAVPPQVQVGNAAGAGDALLATYLVGILKGWSLEQRITRAIAAGAASARGLGTNLASPEDVYSLERQVKLMEC